MDKSPIIEAVREIPVAFFKMCKTFLEMISSSFEKRFRWDWEDTWSALFFLVVTGAILFGTYTAWMALHSNSDATGVYLVRKSYNNNETFHVKEKVDWRADREIFASGDFEEANSVFKDHQSLYE